MSNLIQCKLQKDKSVQITWIPEYSPNKVKIKAGLSVPLKLQDGTFDKGWLVLETGLIMDAKLIKEREHARRSDGAFKSLNKAGGRLKE